MSTDRRCETCEKWKKLHGTPHTGVGLCTFPDKDGIWDGYTVCTWQDAVCPEWTARENKWLRAAREWWTSPKTNGLTTEGVYASLADHFRKVAEGE